tara:strand:- start:8458 stop:8673 length:216 start_codon:yes stop_codon:yes gene_type:complete
MKLYKTGEIHSNGSEVYRQVGDKPRAGRLGLLGTYYIGNAEQMCVCGKGYKDEYGVWDGEPLWPVYDFSIK